VTFRLRRCSRCGETKTIDVFPRNRSAASGYGYHCKPCHNRVSRENREKNHGSTRDFALRRRYGLDGAAVDALVIEQEGVCAICRIDEARHLDHDHTTGSNRGVLCFSCNGALGQFEDDARLLLKAAQYLDQPRLICAASGLLRKGVERTCLACGISKARSEFPGGRPAGSDGPPFCRSCYDRRDTVAEVGTLVRRHYRLRRRYGIGLEQFARLLEEQRGRCAICGSADAGNVDHDHVAGLVRGVLCATCNTGMGQFRDDPAIIRRAIAYLERWQTRPGAVQEPAAPYILSVA
jgi:recombination endonuclease VII